MAILAYDFLSVLLFIFLLPSASSVYFQIPSFSPNLKNILYLGDAAPSAGAAELNNDQTYNCRVGWAIYAERVPLWDSDAGELADFSSKFSFTIDTKGSSRYADGMAFFLGPVGFQVPLNSAGEFLGLFNTTTAYLSSNQIVMVEFDTRQSVKWDPSDVLDHVGINKNSLASSVYTGWNASFHSGDTADVQITYNATSKNLSVSWTWRRTFNPREKTNLFYIIDLVNVLPQWVTVGFSAATGLSNERHVIRSWEFSSSLEIKATDGVNKKMIRIIAPVIVSMVVLIAAAVAGLVISKRRKQMQRKSAQTMNLTSINDDLERGAGPRKFSDGDLASATNNFSDNKKLGQGGFGAVYRGYLIDSDMGIAVKKVSRGSKQGKKEYIAEVKTIGRLRHRNLVQLIGWCHDKGEFLLVYEFMPNGSLDSHLFSKRSLLTWATRYKISLGLASALLYLHEGWEQCVVHRDIKSSNIMLDSNFNVKLGDFGLARLMDHELGPQTTGLAGTLGYLAPECISTGRASKESDVFSFGVVALEIATGKKSIDPKRENSDVGLVELVWDLYGSGGLLSGVDERLEMNFDEKQVECLMIVGLWCAHPNFSSRPSIKQALQVLNFEAELPNLPTKMPVPTYQIPTPLGRSSEPFLTHSSFGVGR